LTPARFLDRNKDRGAIIPGARADFVALTPELDVIATWLAGSPEYVKSN
jgi:N-acetylglucosamine-6-phosphate deacetylase